MMQRPQSQQRWVIGVAFPNPDNQFRPGQSGNPGGRPKGRSVTARLRDLLEKGEINGKPIKGGKQVADLVAETIVKHALAGDIAFMRLLVDRNDGKIPESAEDGDGASGATIEAETARRVLQAVRGGEIQREEGDGR
jgi:hypothetical protein